MHAYLYVYMHVYIHVYTHEYIQACTCAYTYPVSSHIKHTCSVQVLSNNPDYNIVLIHFCLFCTSFYSNVLIW